MRFNPSYLFKIALLSLVASLFSACTDLPSDPPTPKQPPIPVTLQFTKKPEDTPQTILFPKNQEKTTVTAEFTCLPQSCKTTCSLDNAPPQPCSSPYQTEVGQGVHTLTVTGTSAKDVKTISAQFTRVKQPTIEIKGLIPGVKITPPNGVSGDYRQTFSRDLGHFKAICPDNGCQVTCSYRFGNQEKVTPSDCSNGAGIHLQIPSTENDVLIHVKACVTVGGQPYCDTQSLSYTFVPPKWKEVYAGKSISCGIQTDDTLWCWGAQTFGLLGNGQQSGSSAPVKVLSGEGEETWMKVDIGPKHVCAIKGDKTLWCWGSQENGVLGNGQTTGTSTRPVKINLPGKSDSKWKDVGVAEGRTCAISDSTDNTYCWGNNTLLGISNTATAISTPTEVTTSKRFSTIAVAKGWSNATTLGAPPTGAEYYAWGKNSTSGRLGIGNSNDADTPTHLSTFRGLEQVKLSISESFGCALVTPFNSSDHRRALCWGDATYGQTGRGDNTSLVSLNYGYPVVGSDDYIDVSAAKDANYACGLNKEGKVFCWGENSNHLISNGAETSFSSPHELEATKGKKYKKIAVAFDHSCAIDQDDHLDCWGIDHDHILGSTSASGQFQGPNQVTVQ